MPPKRKKRKLHRYPIVVDLVVVVVVHQLPLEIWEMILHFVEIQDILCLLRHKKAWNRSKHMMVTAARSICAHLINRMADHVDNVALYYDLDSNKEWKTTGKPTQHQLDIFNPPAPILSDRNLKTLKLYEMVAMIPGRQDKYYDLYLIDAVQDHYVVMTKHWIKTFMKSQGLRWSLNQDVTPEEINRLFSQSGKRNEYSYFSLWIWMPCFGSRIVIGIRTEITGNVVMLCTLFNGEYMLSKPWVSGGNNISGPDGMHSFLKHKMEKVIYYMYNYITNIGSPTTGQHLDQRVIYFLDDEKKKDDLKIL